MKTFAEILIGSAFLAAFLVIAMTPDSISAPPITTTETTFTPCTTDLDCAHKNPTLD